MKYKYLFLMLLLFVASIKTAEANNSYPDMMVNPMYSILNPAYFDAGMDSQQQAEQETLKDIINRRRAQFRQQEKEAKMPKQTKAEMFEKEKKEGISLRKQDAIDSFYEPDDPIVEEEEFEDEYNYEEEQFQEEENLDSEQAEEEKEGFVTKKKKKSSADLVKEIEKEQREREKALSGEVDVPLKEKLKFWKRDKKKVEVDKTPKEPDVEISADFMEYYPDRYEVEAVGNAKVTFNQGGFVLSANKIVFNYDLNILTAKENVSLLSNELLTEGDFIRIDLSNPDGIIEKPITKTEEVILSAKEALLYSDRIEEYEGVAKILSNEKLKLGATSFNGYVDPGNVFSSRLQQQEREYTPGVYSLKAKEIIIDSKDNKEVVTVKNASLYFKNHKIAVLPSIKIYSNKERSIVETNAPEFGSVSSLGTYLGPGVVLNVPGGSTLKLAPALTYGDNKLGIGGIARFRNPYNLTEVAYGTSKDQLVIRGRQQLGKGLTFDYSKLTNQSEWFMGYRMPKYAAQLRYVTKDYIKDLDLHFAQMYTAGAYVDRYGKNSDIEDVEGRFRWMTQSYKSLYQLNNEEGNIGLNLGLVAQTGATAYTTGDVHGILRVGPSVNTKLGPWQQSLIYYQTAIAGQSPFEFDRYRYGRSNLVLIESLRVSKYLSLGYLASLALNRDARNDDMLQENRILVSVGPDYAKVTFGYDSIRKNAMVLFSMLVGTQDSEVAFDKTVIKNPQKFGKKANKSKRNERKEFRKELKKQLKEQKQLEKEYEKQLKEHEYVEEPVTEEEQQTPAQEEV